MLLEAVEQLQAGVQTMRSRVRGGWPGRVRAHPRTAAGVHRYREIVDWVRAGYDPARTRTSDDTEAEELRAWLPDGFDPNAFDVEETNAALAMAARGSVVRRVGWDLPVEVADLLAAMDEPASSETSARPTHPTWWEPVLLDVTTPRRWCGPGRHCSNRSETGSLGATEFVCFSDTLAMGVLRALEERGDRAGQDIGLVGLDDSAAAQLTGLTSVRQPLEQGDVELIGLLHVALTGEPAPEHGTVLTPTLVVRSSSRRA